MESHLFSKDRRLNQYIHFEMLLYIHTQTTTYIYRTSKNKQTSPTQKRLQPGTSASPTPHQGSAERCLECSRRRVSLHGLLTWERQNVKMLAKEQLVSYSCLVFCFVLFFLLKKPLNVEVLSSLAGRVVSTISPQGSRAGADVALSKAPRTGRWQADSEGLSPRLLWACGFQQLPWFQITVCSKGA